MSELARDLFIFVLVTAGLALPVAQRARRFDPLERLTIGIATGVTVVGLFSFGLYVLRLDPRWHWLLAAVALAGGGLTWPRAKDWLQTAEIGAAAGQWLLFALWCLGMLALVFSYSGGGWSGDWHEHYERTLFFLHHWPTDHLFINTYPLTARPPLGNLATGAFLALTNDRLAQFQVFTLLLNTLIFFPVLLFARNWGAGTRAGALVALVLMLNPSVMENATFAWTKLIAAFFTATGVYFLARDVRLPDTGSARAGGWALAAALLTHYSAAPWLLAFGAAWFWAKRPAWRRPDFWRTSAGTVAICSVPLAIWFGWAVRTYGWSGTFAANTSVVGLVPMGFGEMGQAFLVKFWCTLIPHPWRWADLSIITQTNRLTWLRDYFFCIYQVNLPFAFGSAGLFLLMRTWFRPRSAGPPLLAPPERSFWWLGVIIVVPLGVAVHGETDTIGLAHICLQPLIAIGLAAAIAQLGRELASGGTRLLWATLAFCWAVDAFLGIVLNFAAQAFALGAGDPPDVAAYAHGLNQAALSNFGGKLRLAQPFLHDRLDFPNSAAALFLLGLLALACWQALGSGRRLPARNSSAQKKNS